MSNSPSGSDSVSRSKDGSSSEPAADLRGALGDAGNFINQVAKSLATASKQAATVERRLSELERRLGEVEEDSRDLALRLVSSEQQSVRLMSLYVATYQLHSTLDPAEVRATIAEIAINLLGAERFVLLLRSEPTGACEIALSEGLEEDDSGLFQNGRYVGNDPMVDATLADGVLRVGPMDESVALAAVPLVVQDATVGVLIILKLLDHKGRLAAQDHDLLDLLGAHAASALFAAQVHSTADRKLRTLESLVKLVRRTG